MGGKQRHESVESKWEKWKQCEQLEKRRKWRREREEEEENEDWRRGDDVRENQDLEIHCDPAVVAWRTGPEQGK